MPIYEWKCPKCGTTVESITTQYDPPARKCPKCKKAKMVKQQSAPAFQIK